MLVSGRWVALPQFLGALMDELKGTGILAQIPVGYPGSGVTRRVKCFGAQEGRGRQIWTWR